MEIRWGYGYAKLPAVYQSGTSLLLSFLQLNIKFDHCMWGLCVMKLYRSEIRKSFEISHSGCRTSFLRSTNKNDRLICSFITDQASSILFEENPEMSDYKYDEYGNKYVRLPNEGNAGCALLFLGYVVWCALNAFITWLEGVFVQVAKIAQWIYNPPLAKGFSQSAEGLVGAWYWLTILKPFSLLLHLIGAFFGLLGFVCGTIAHSATTIWGFGLALTPYPNLNLVLSLLLELGAGAVLIFAASLLVGLVAQAYKAIDDFWAHRPSLHHNVGAALTTLKEGYLFSLPLPFIFLIGLKIWQWIFATA